MRRFDLEILVGNAIIERYENLGRRYVTTDMLYKYSELVEKSMIEDGLEVTISFELDRVLDVYPFFFYSIDDVIFLKENVSIMDLRMNFRAILNLKDIKYFYSDKAIKILKG